MKASVFKPVAPSNSGAYPVRQSNGGSATRRLHRKQAAEFLGVSLSWLDKARISGLGPDFMTMGGRVLYDSRDLEAFIDGNSIPQLQNSTSATFYIAKLCILQVFHRLGNCI